MSWVLGVVPIAVLLGLWWLVTGSGPAEERVISPTILPSPLEVVRSFPSLWFDRALTRNVARLARPGGRPASRSAWPSPSRSAC